jgi:hypothetical protein
LIETPVLSRRQLCQLLGALAVPAGARAAEKTALEAPIVVEDGRLWISAQIGERVLRFIIDTGAGGNFIRPEIAKALDLQNVSMGLSVGGVGGKSRVVGTVEAHDVVVGGVVRQKRMQFSTYDFRRGLPADAAGLFAAGVVTAYDSDLVLGETLGNWRIWLNGRNAAPQGTLLPRTTISHRGEFDGSQRIVVTAWIDDQAYRLLADTGAPDALMLFSRATARSGLWNAPSWAPERVSGFGGAASRLSRITRASRLQFGPMSLKRPFVTLTDPAQAAFGDIDGVIGLRMLSLFDLSIDASAGKVWARRNARRPTADSYPRSGLLLQREADGATRIAAVGGGSPGAVAGAQAGDRLTGKIPDVFGRINGAAGQAVELDVVRDGKPGQIKMTLADYL